MSITNRGVPPSSPRERTTLRAGCRVSDFATAIVREIAIAKAFP